MRTSAGHVLREVLRAIAVHARRSRLSRDDFLRAARAAFDAAGCETGGTEKGLSYEEGMRIVGRWLGDRRFTEGGKPVSLAYRGPISFASLAAAAGCADPAAALRALRRSGHVEVDRKGRIRLLRTAFLPRSPAGTAAAVRHAVFDLVGALLHNADASRREVFLQRAATYDNIPAGSLGTLRAGLRREGEDLMVRANALLSRHDRDRNPQAGKGGRNRVTLGVYYFEAPIRSARARKKGQ